VLLDEIGRGTSTYDGVSIAWSVSEFLHDVIKCKTVFATHYHELTQLADELVAVSNYSVEVREVGDQVLFMHRVIPGGADRSYGIEVGRLAGLPPTVLQRARNLLSGYETQSASRLRGAGENRLTTDPATQLGLFAAHHPLVDELTTIDTNSMTPLEALTLLTRLVTRARQG